MAYPKQLPPIFYNNKKRYVIRFNTFTDKILSKSVTEYDTLDEAMEEIKLLNEFYKSTPRPERQKRDKYSTTYDVFYSEGAMYWGYVLLDYEEQKILKIGNDGLYGGINKKYDPLILLDHFFRKEEEIPKNYSWDVGEFDGWLQFRWGNGKNAINYKEVKETGKKNMKRLLEMEETFNPDDAIFEPEVDESEIEELEEKYDKILEKEIKELKEYKW